MHGERWTVWVEARRSLSHGLWKAASVWSEHRDIEGVQTTERMFGTLGTAKKEAARRVWSLQGSPFFEFGGDVPTFDELPFSEVEVGDDC